MVKFNPKLKQDVAKFVDYVILVEGKKDVASLEALGFTKVYAIHETGIGLRERAEQILADIDLRKDKICILTDFDKKGKQLYLQLKSILAENGAKLDSSLRGLLLKSGLSHIEGLYEFMSRVDAIG